MKWVTLPVLLLCSVCLMIAACGSQKQPMPYVRAVGAYGDIVLDTAPFNDRVAVQVAVLGHVASPGVYSTELNSLREVVALAGGPTSDADLTRVSVIPLDGYHSVKVINMEAILEETARFVLHLNDGDTVYIPARVEQRRAN